MENSTIVELFFKKVVAELDFLEKVTKDLSILFRNSSQPTLTGGATTTTTTTTTTTENPLVPDADHGSPVLACIAFAIVIAVLFTVIISCFIVDKIEKQNKSRQLRQQLRRQSQNVNAAAENRNNPNADNSDPFSLVLSVNLPPPGARGPPPPPYEEPPAYQNLFDVKIEDKIEETVEEKTKMTD